MIIAGLLNSFCIVVFILNKKGIIVIKENKEKQEERTPSKKREIN